MTIPSRLVRKTPPPLEVLVGSERNPPLAPARGVAFGALLGVLVWAALAAGLGALFSPG